MQTPKLLFFDYTRKSLKDEDRQAISLESQEYDLSVLAKREGIKVKDHFSESRTAKVPGRPEFNRMLDGIERGEANGILVWDIDRLYRNPVDEGRVRWLLQQGIIASILTPTRQYFPQDAGLLMAVEGGRAIEHNLRFAKALKRTYEAKLRNGQWPGTLAHTRFDLGNIGRNARAAFAARNSQYFEKNRNEPPPLEKNRHIFFFRGLRFSPVFIGFCASRR